MNKVCRLKIRVSASFCLPWVMASTSLFTSLSGGGSSIGCEVSLDVIGKQSELTGGRSDETGGSTSLTFSCFVTSPSTTVPGPLSASSILRCSASCCILFFLGGSKSLWPLILAIVLLFTIFSFLGESRFTKFSCFWEEPHSLGGGGCSCKMRRLLDVSEFSGKWFMILDRN